MRRALMLFICLAAAATTFAAEKRNITEKDLFNFIWIGDPQLSPDGSRVVFVRVSVNEKKEGYDTSLWSVSTAGGEEPHRLTSGTHDTTPRWSPDGKFVTFIRATEKDGKPEPGQLCMLPMGGGEAWQFTSLPKGAGNPVWSPDGKTIAFTSTSNPDDLAKADKKKREEEAKRGAADGASPSPSPAPSGKPDERESDVHVVTRAVYRSNNEGYLDPKRPSHIWTIQAPRSAEEKVQPKQLMTGRFRESDPTWSKDGTQILFTSLHNDEPYYDLPKTELYSVATTGGEPTKITTINMGVSDLSLSPDGKQLAFVASVDEPVNSYTQPDLWVMDLAPNAQPKNLTASFDFDVTNPVFGDNAAPRAGGSTPVVWSADSKSIYEIFSRQGRTNIGRFDAATGALTEVTKGDQAVMRFDITPDGGKIMYEVSTPTRINDLFVIDGNAAPRQLTDVNRELFAQLNLTEPEEIWYDSFDGKKIQTWVQKPPGFDAKKKYPLILNIHGGPHAAYGFVFAHEFQWMAAKGYVVLYPNPRGSTTYGQEFGNIIQHHYPGDDFKDLMIGVDELVRRGYIDEKKMGVTGGSGGGLLTNWTIGHTDRFAAAVSQRDIASWAHWWYTADFTL
ncbi:MAG: prolyl oligopeptidase family serine peptidase, partial [Chthoniobacterales bacterium]